MKQIKLIITTAVAVCAIGLVNTAKATPVLDTGWTYDQIDAALTPSEASPMVFTLGSSALFSVTDQFVVGDTYSVWDFGTLILTTTFNGAQTPFAIVGDATGEAGWENGSYSHGSVLLGAGDHSLVLAGDGAGGVPAGLYERLDSVPDSSVTIGMLGLGLMAIAAARRRLA